MDRLKNAILIVNAGSNHGAQQYVAAKSMLVALGLREAYAWQMDRTADIQAKVSEAISEGVKLIIVGGGDGTLNSVVNLFVGTQAVLGVLPLGTGNQFVRDLGIEPALEPACKVLMEGKVSHVDLGTAGNGFFLNIATVGLTTLITEGLDESEKRRLGRFAYTYAIARAMLLVQPFRVTLTMPEGRCSFRALQVVVGNGRFHAGPFPVGTEATIVDGKLTAYVVASRSRWGLVWCALRLPGGHQDTLNEVHTFTTTDILLETKKPIRITVDGDIKYKTPMHFGIARRALRVMTPQAFAQETEG